MKIIARCSTNSNPMIGVIVELWMKDNGEYIVKEFSNGGYSEYTLLPVVKEKKRTSGDDDHRQGGAFIYGS